MRCLAGEPRRGTLQLGSAQLRFEGRTLRIEGVSQPVRVAAFSGPAFYAAPTRSELEALRRARPALVLLLGDLGDDAGRARATFEALASLEIPILVLAGGRDTPTRIAAASEGLGEGKAWIVDISPLAEVHVAGFTWIPLAGAAEGRYASSDDGCGYGAADLGLRAAVARRSRAPLFTQLVAWERPEAWPSSGAAAGDAGPVAAPSDLADLARLAGGVFAWPADQPGPGPLAAGHSLGVPRLTGPHVALEDGGRLSPGFLLLSLDAGGLSGAPL